MLGWAPSYLVLDLGVAGLICRPGGFLGWSAHQLSLIITTWASSAAVPQVAYQMKQGARSGASSPVLMMSGRLTYIHSTRASFTILPRWDAGPVLCFAALAERDRASSVVLTPPPQGQLFFPLQVAKGGGGIFPSPLPSRGIQRKAHQQFSHTCAAGLADLRPNWRVCSVVGPRQSEAPDLLRAVTSGARAECQVCYSHDLRSSSPTLYILPHPLTAGQIRSGARSPICVCFVRSPAPLWWSQLPRGGIESTLLSAASNERQDQLSHAWDVKSCFSCLQ